jgi:LPXTG-site transpeptidase (sortase) family protein
MLKESQVKFIWYFIVIFGVVFILLYSAGLVPESIKLNQGDSLRTLWDKAQGEAVIEEKPIRIVIDKIDVDVAVSNPNTTNVATLDEYLKQGAVRYPGSGFLGSGNMFLFAHSTGIKVVNNQAYKAFNGLKNLSSGDIIKVFSKNKVYQYKVTSVILVDQTKALVEFNSRKNMLTLSTCNTFGAKSERYVVEADFII